MELVSGSIFQFLDVMWQTTDELESPQSVMIDYEWIIRLWIMIWMDTSTEDSVLVSKIWNDL